jgi:dihydropteroate synthase
VAWAATNKASIVRVHDVEETVQFLKVWQEIARAKGAEA